MNNIYTYLEKLQKNYVNSLIIFFIWCSLFISLNTNFVTIFNLIENLNFINIVKARSILLIISFFLIIFFIIKNKIKFKNNFFYLLLLIILAIQSIYFFSDDFNLLNKISLTNIYEKNLFSDRYYGIQLQAIQLFLSIFISLFLILIFNEKKNEEAFTISFLFFLSIFCIFYFSLYISSLPSHINSPSVLFYLNSFWSHESTIFPGEPQIRITGIARSLLIISLILLCLYLLFQKKKLQLKLPLLILIIFINTSIILTGSRFASYSLLLTYSFLIILLDIKFLNKIKYFLVFLIIPFIIFVISGNIIKDIQLNKKLKSFNIEKSDTKTSKELENILEDTKIPKELKKILEEKNLNKSLEEKNLGEVLEIINSTRYVDKLNNTTGRVQIWRNALEIVKERNNYFFGNGINADRRLLVKYGNIFGTNASNGFINIYLTSGILGFCLFILANLIILRKFYIFIFIEKCFLNFKKYYLINLSIIIIFVLYQRIFFENSFTSFGLDYLIYIVCCFFVLNNIRTLKPDKN